MQEPVVEVRLGSPRGDHAAVHEQLHDIARSERDAEEAGFGGSGSNDAQEQRRLPRHGCWGRNRWHARDREEHYADEDAHGAPVPAAPIARALAGARLRVGYDWNHPEGHRWRPRVPIYRFRSRYRM